LARPNLLLRVVAAAVAKTQQPARLPHRIDSVSTRSSLWTQSSEGVNSVLVCHRVEGREVEHLGATHCGADMSAGVEHTSAEMRLDQTGWATDLRIMSARSTMGVTSLTCGYLMRRNIVEEESPWISWSRI
jgi:hypothetical protein